MSDIGLGGVDFSLGLENFNAELLAYGQTPEGQAAFDQLRQDLGIDPSLFGGGGPPDPPALDDDEEEEVDPIAQQMQLDREFAQQQAAQQTAQRRQDARTTMAAVLDTYGLGDLSDFVYNEIIAKETVNINNPDAIIFAIREQPAYKKRFAGNAARLKKLACQNLTLPHTSRWKTSSVKPSNPTVCQRTSTTRLRTSKRSLKAMFPHQS
jgi:hypothetical protein